MGEKEFKNFISGIAVLLVIGNQIFLTAKELGYNLISLDIEKNWSIGFTILTLILGYELGQFKLERSNWKLLRFIYFNYWLLFVFFSCTVIVNKGNVYQGNIKSILFDVLGFSGVSGTISLCSTSWYMSVIILGTCLFPFIRPVVRWLPFSILGGAIFGLCFAGSYYQCSGTGKILYGLLILLVGGCCSEEKIALLLQKVSQCINWKRCDTLLALILLLGISCYLRVKCGIVMELTVGGSVLLLLYCVWNVVPPISEWFVYIGEHWFLGVLFTGYLMECGFAKNLFEQYDSGVILVIAALSGVLCLTFFVTKWKEIVR